MEEHELKRLLVRLVQGHAESVTIVVAAYVIGPVAGIIVAMHVIHRAGGAAWGTPLAIFACFSIACAIVYSGVCTWSNLRRKFGERSKGGI